jgi:hydrocephalus-inducing protein
VYHYFYPFLPHFRVVFSQRKKDMKLKEVVVKKYVVSMEKFYFGPLLCGKSRDK